uniref:Uncharacterized protein n=1 Tax=Rhizophora mucronata TaxID=61149 RepID=A0A2P2QPL6_RHIMU
MNEVNLEDNKSKANCDLLISENYQHKNATLAPYVTERINLMHQRTNTEFNYDSCLIKITLYHT